MSFDPHALVLVQDPALLEMVSGGVALGYKNNNTYYVNDQCTPNMNNETCVQANQLCGADTVCAEVI
ncbi:MAG TPA: hypothetical protein VM240_12690 [Verrucomicrobiae bacterium]|nr:hypothetical protein [Verrucomicrobiae bacterium]